MKSAVITLCVFLFLFPYSAHGQINDCPNAQVVCDDENLSFNPIGPGFNDYADPDNDEGCITALEQNSAWYYFQIDPAAPPGLVLGFTIRPNGGLGEDYDWALYGPDANCGNLGSPIRCSSSSAACGFCPETGMGMGAMDVTEGPGTGDGFVMTLPVEPGQGFYLMIDNWLGTTNGFILSWQESAAAFLNCDASPPCALDAQAGPDVNACEGDMDLILNGGSNGNHGNETYEWSGDNGGTAFLDDPTLEDPSMTFPPGFTGTITYTLTVAEDTCLSVDEMNVTVHPLPTASITQIGPFCANRPPVSLSAMPPGGIWGGDATGNTFNPITNGPGVHTVTYTYTDNNGCSIVESMDITVHDVPDISISPIPAEFCESENAILLTATATGGAGGYVYQWSSPSGTGDDAEYSAIGPGQHVVTVTDANGCTNSSAIPVVMHLNPEIEITEPDPICGGLQLYTLSATPSGGSFDGDYISAQGDLNPDMIPPGTYTISYSFTDNYDCASTGYMDITIVPVPLAIAGNTGPYCEGQPIFLTGQTDVTGTLEFEWSGPNGYTSTAQNPTNATAPGEYLLEVFVDGCPSATFGTTTVIVHDAPEAIAANSGPYCNGETIQLMGSTNDSGNTITYAWTGPNGFTSDVQNPSNAIAAGVYSLIISIDGCTSAVTTTDVVFNNAPNASASNSGPYCAGASIALFGNTITPGTLITYQWSGPNGYTSSLQNPTDAVAPGQYDLIVDVDGCKSFTVSTTVTVNALPQPLITGQSEFCTGFSSTMDAGAGYMSYLWDNSSTNRIREVFAAGTYVVTVTDVNGCSGTAAFTVTENTSLTPAITGALEFCEGESTTLDAGPGFAGYVWSTGEMTQTIVVTDEGNIGVVVTDADGCTGAAAITTTVHDNPIVIIGGSSTYCIGGFTVLNAGVYDSYLWSNNETTQTITASTPGTYRVSVTDLNGCTGIGSVTVSESTSLNPVITGSHAFCENGTTTLDAGSGFATYLWSDGSINQTLVVDSAGSYSVSVSDGQGCFGETSVPIIEVSPPVAQLQSSTSLCNTIAGGSILDLYDLIQSGDMTGSWQDMDNSGAVGLFDNLNFVSVPAGDYRFLYTTNSAVSPCPEETYQVIITVIDCTCPDVFFVNAGALCNAGDVLDVTTIENTSEDGTWSLIQTPIGVNPAALNGNIFDPTSSDPGEYVLLFSLENQPPPGCPVDFQVMVQVDASVDAGVAAQPAVFCTGDDQYIILSGMITGADANGTWTEISSFPSQGGAFDPAGGTFNADNQLPGIYVFRYALAPNGACPADETIVSVVINAVPTVVISDDVVIDCANPIQSLNATGSSNGSEYFITWTGPGLLMDGSEQTLNPAIDQAGNYMLTIENIETGCSSSASVAVTANTDPPTGALINSDDPACFGEQNGFIHIDQVFGGSAPYVYSVNGNAVSANADYDQLTAGEYILEIVDDNGCRWDTTIVLIEPASIQIEIGPDIELELGESTSVQATINIPTNQIELLSWTPDAFIECIDLNCLEVSVYPFYSIILNATVFDLNGCKSTDTLNIFVDTDRNVYIPNIFSPNGDGVNDEFLIHADPRQVRQINQFTIFNRWGGVVYEAKDFAPNDPSIHWDGSNKDKVVNPGVFTYVVELEFVDEIVLRYVGDVTVVR